MSHRPRRWENEERHPAVRDALDAMRDEAPSADSRRAMLAALGLDATAPSPASPSGARRRTVVSFLGWFLGGVALVCLGATLWGWLGG